jgi:hypothetical protein
MPTGYQETVSLRGRALTIRFSDTNYCDMLSIAREQVGKHVSWDTKIADVDSWKPAGCCGINRRVHE